MKVDAIHWRSSSPNSPEQIVDDDDGGWGTAEIVDWAAAVVAGTVGGGLVLATRMLIQTDAPPGWYCNSPSYRQDEEGRSMNASCGVRTQAQSRRSRLQQTGSQR